MRTGKFWAELATVKYRYFWGVSNQPYVNKQNIILQNCGVVGRKCVDEINICVLYRVNCCRFEPCMTLKQQRTMSWPLNPENSSVSLTTGNLSGIDTQYGFLLNLQSFELMITLSLELIINVIIFYAFLNIQNINIIHYHLFYQTLKEDFILIVLSVKLVYLKQRFWLTELWVVSVKICQKDHFRVSGWVTCYPSECFTTHSSNCKMVLFHNCEMFL